MHERYMNFDHPSYRFVKLNWSSERKKKELN